MGKNVIECSKVHVNEGKGTEYLQDVRAAGFRRWVEDGI
jgi:hypothetical protein